MIKPSSGLVMVMVGGWLDWAKAGGITKIKRSEQNSRDLISFIMCYFDDLFFVFKNLEALVLIGSLNLGKTIKKI